MLENITEETSQRLLNTKFRLFLEPSRTVELELVEVSGGRQQKAGGGDSFSLVFRGPGDALLTQRTYRMEHSELGTFDLFIVPIRRDRDNFYYEAVFNRLAPS